VIVSVIAGLIAKLPAFFNLDEELFYSRNVGFIVFPAITAYFAWRNNVSIGKIAMIFAASLAGFIFINALPDNKNSDSIFLSCVHLALYLWAILGFAFVGDDKDKVNKWMGYLRYNGDLVVMTSLILIAGAIMTAITIGLFSMIGINIEKFYGEWVVVFGLSAAPMVGTYLTQNNPQLVSRVSPVIARIFSPLVLVMLITYLAAIIYSGKDPYNDREFLLVFNGLLAGVMAIIFFSVAETRNTERYTWENWVLFFLSVLTIVVNGIALSAIVFRISEWGFTPNRAAVLGGNILILVNLLLVTARLLKVLTKKEDISVVAKVITFFLPVYFIWVTLVTFVFPFLFGFK
jgi:hypothetical protein